MPTLIITLARVVDMRKGKPSNAEFVPRKREKTQEEKDEVPKRYGLEKESSELQSSQSKNKVHPLEVTEIAKTGQQDGVKREVTIHCSESKTNEVQETSEKGRNGIPTGRNFERVAKTAWMN